MSYPDPFHGLSFRGELGHQRSMAEHTSWRTGGAAEWYFTPRDRSDLAAFMAHVPPRMPIYWVGLGSNLLVRDGGLHGLVINTHKGLSALEFIAPDRVSAEAGVPSAKTARFAARHALEQAEFLAGIPGTIGGALAMNAGAFGRETWSVVESVEVMQRNGRIERRAAASFTVAYRQVTMAVDEWFVSACLRLQPGSGADALTRVKALLAKRGASQPVQTANAGSVFRNPPGDYAARLIEAAGLKGYIIGDAQVARKHANFIVNRGRASAADIESLIDHVQRVVERRYHVKLQPEVRIVGEPV